MLTFLHISDTHISGDPAYHPPWIPASIPHPNRGVERLIEAILDLPVDFDFILHTGDVCADPHEADYHCARDLLRRLPGPLYLLPGNHDSPQFMQDILQDDGMRVLRDAHVDLGGLQLLTLDTSGEGDEHAPTLTDAQIDAFARRLDAIGDEPVIVGLHHGLLETGVPWLDEEMRVQNGERIQRLLERHRAKVAGVFFGHIHQQAETHRGGIWHVCCPSTWSNLQGYPGLREGLPDPTTPGGFNLVRLGEGGAFLRRFNLPWITR